VIQGTRTAAAANPARASAAGVITIRCVGQPGRKAVTFGSKVISASAAYSGLSTNRFCVAEQFSVFAIT